jgi:hypothetical protein
MGSTKRGFPRYSPLAVSSRDESANQKVSPAGGIIPGILAMFAEMRRVIHFGGLYAAFLLEHGLLDAHGMGRPRNVLQDLPRHHGQFGDLFARLEGCNPPSDIYSAVLALKEVFCGSIAGANHACKSKLLTATGAFRW